jgi:hypothetical protein
MLAPFLLVLTLTGQAVPVATPVAAPAEAPLSREQMEHFLATAKVVGHHGINKGITNPIRLTLSDGAITHDAAFTYVNEHRGVMELDSGRTELNFVAKMLALDGMMPVTVPYRYDSTPGALSWWVDVKMDEGERVKKKIEAPDQNAWGEQIYRMRVFSALVADTDRNAGNILIGPDWKLWMIDFTRAFRTWKNLEKPELLARCDKRLLGSLRILTADGIVQQTDNLLTTQEINALLARRDEILKRFDELIAQKGVAKVLY